MCNPIYIYIYIYIYIKETITLDVTLYECYTTRYIYKPPPSDYTFSFFLTLFNLYTHVWCIILKNSY
jgi:hypothetical protein